LSEEAWSNAGSTSAEQPGEFTAGFRKARSTVAGAFGVEAAGAVAAPATDPASSSKVRAIPAALSCIQFSFWGRLTMRREAPLIDSSRKTGCLARSPARQDADREAKGNRKALTAS
jgi:hypothetical protein